MGVSAFSLKRIRVKAKIVSRIQDTVIIIQPKKPQFQDYLG